MPARRMLSSQLSRSFPPAQRRNRHAKHVSRFANANDPFHLVQNRKDSLRLHVYCSSPSYSVMHRSFKIAALRKKKHRTSWISVFLYALYEARRRQAISDIRRHRHLFRRPEHLELYEQAVGEIRACRRLPPQRGPSDQVPFAAGRTHASASAD
jgi:hypothetical protein